jgi:AcrR family transcriptional regulator
VLTSATELADVEGLEALTMRRVAEALRVAPMTLYTYLPGKAELLDLMLDAAYAGMPLADTSQLPWRQRLTAVAEENHALYRGHPWAADICTARPPLGPGLMAKYEHELAAFEGLGLDDVTTDAALTHLLGFVQSCARMANEVAAIRPAGAPGDERWWAANAPLLARVLDPASYPRAVRVGTAAGQANGAAYSPAHAYEFGLARVLEGLGVLIESSAGQALQPGRTRPVS